MIFITRWNLKPMISTHIFTFYIINQICIIILYQIRLVFLIFEIKYCLTEVLEQPGGGTLALNVMVVYDQRHANVSKQRTLLADADVAPPHGSAPITWLVNVFHREMNCNKNASFISGDCNKTHPTPCTHTDTHRHHTHKSWFHIRYSYSKETMTMSIWQTLILLKIIGLINHAVNGVWFGNNAYTRLITHMQIRYNAIRNGFWSGFNMKIEPRHGKTNKMICAPSEDSDQPGHPPSLIRVCAVRLKQNWILSYPLSAQRRLWSDWADAQADLSLRWAQRSFCWVSHEAAQNASSSSLNMQHIYTFRQIFFLHFA